MCNVSITYKNRMKENVPSYLTSKTVFLKLGDLPHESEFNDSSNSSSSGIAGPRDY